MGDPSSLVALEEKLNEEVVDLLINNAGIFGDRSHQRLENIQAENWQRVLQINTVAPLLVTRACLAALHRGTLKRVAFLTSRMGSIAGNTSGGSYAYRSSKAALNAVIKSLALDLKKEGDVDCCLTPWLGEDGYGRG